MNKKVKTILAIVIAFRLISDIIWINLNYFKITLFWPEVSCYINPKCSTTADVLFSFSYFIVAILNWVFLFFGILGLVKFIRYETLNRSLVAYCCYVMTHFLFSGLYITLALFVCDSLQLMSKIQFSVYAISNIALIVCVIIIFSVHKQLFYKYRDKFTTDIDNRHIRLANYGIDTFITIIFSYILYVEFLLKYAGLSFYLVLLIVNLIYYISTEGVFKQTLGKIATNTMVVHEDREVRFLNILVRTICRRIPFEPFSFLIGKAIGWHDKISKTYLMKK